MHPEIWQIPFIHASIKSYGLMIVIGLLAAIFVIRKLSDRIGMTSVNKDNITNGALYALIAGVIGARIFYVIHHFENFHGNLVSVLYIWQGGLELLGGVILAVLVILAYLLFLRLPVRRYFDIIAIGLMLTLAFGRIGCFLNGCCYGKPSTLPWAVRFPYGSLPYQSQVFPDPARHRDAPHLALPYEYYGMTAANDTWVQALPEAKFNAYLKPRELLTPSELKAVTDEGPYRCLPVHPTQIYSSLDAFGIALILYLFWRYVGYGSDGKMPKWRIGKPGCTFALMFILYAPARFIEELFRDDNPFEIGTLTISQLIGIGLFILGVLLMIVFATAKADKIMANGQKPETKKPKAKFHQTTV
jgi:phosphatidylglycerol:prolipoprotein diacylglycerol transferase